MTSYKVGGSLEHYDPTYVIRSCDQQLYNALKVGEFCYVFNSRQMGKSSLLVRTKSQLEAEGYCCAVLDMTRIGSQEVTPSQWYKGMVVDLCRGFGCFGQLNVQAWWKNQEDISPVQKLIRFLEFLLLEYFSEQNLCIFIDEIDSILSLSFPIDDFFAVIRSCYNQRSIHSAYKRLTFALFGVATPSDLIQDKIRTPFNLGKAINLSGFSLAEASPLAQGLAQKVERPEAVLKAILAWTNGQPFLTQKLFLLADLALLNSPFKNKKISKGMEEFWIENLVRSQIIDRWESQDEPEHLKTIRDRLLYNQQLAGGVLALYQNILENREVLSDDSRVQTELILSGLAIKVGEFIKVKNKIYQEVFNLNWVKQQLKDLRPYSQPFEAWLASQQTDHSRLLRGQALKDAQDWAKGKTLSSLDYRFLALSQDFELKDKQILLEAERAYEIEKRLIQEQKNVKLQRLLLVAVILGLGVSLILAKTIFSQYQKVAKSEIQALVSSAKALFASDQRFDALLQAIAAQQKLKKLSKIDAMLQSNVTEVLSQTVYGVDEINRLSGHRGSVYSVAFSADGQWIATGSIDRTIKLWKPDGTLLLTLPHPATIYRVALSPNGQLIMGAGMDHHIYIWNRQGQPVRDFTAHQAAIWGLAYHPSGTLMASSSSDRTIKLWNQDGTLKTTFKGHVAPVWNIAFSPDGKTLASASLDGTLKLWTLDGQLQATLKGHQAAVLDVDFCSSDTLVSASADSTVKLWRRDGTLIRTLGRHSGSVLSVNCRNLGNQIVSAGGDRIVKLWTKAGTVLKEFKGHQGIIREVAISPNSEIIASASEDNTVKLWKTKNDLTQTLNGHTSTIWGLAINPVDQTIASGSVDNTIRLWQPNGSTLTVIPERSSGLREVIFSKDGQLLAAVGTGDGTNVSVWQFQPKQTPKIKPFRTFKGHKMPVIAVAFSPDHQWIASGGDDNEIKLWNLHDQTIYSLKGHQARIWQIAFSPKQDFLVSGSEDGTVKVWGLNGQVKKTLAQHHQAVWGVAIHPQGNLIASASRDDTLKLWKPDGTLVRTIQGNSTGFNKVVFSPDGHLLASASADGKVKLWTLEGELKATLMGHKSSVLNLAFSQDNKYLATAGDDKTIILWDWSKILTLDQLQYGCDWVKSYLKTNLELDHSHSPHLSLIDREMCSNSQ